MKNLILIGFTLLFVSCTSQAQKQNEKAKIDKKNMNKEINYSVQKTEQEWQSILTPEEYRILRQKGTERPHTGEYNMHFKSGEYHCKACDALLFESDTKFDAHCGWPSFDQAIEGSIEYKKDTSLGMIRTEILCASCGSHLGHIFDDGPTQTGKRYCVNSVSLNFKKDEE